MLTKQINELLEIKTNKYQCKVIRFHVNEGMNVPYIDRIPLDFLSKAYLSVLMLIRQPVNVERRKLYVREYSYAFGTHAHVLPFH